MSDDFLYLGLGMIIIIIISLPLAIKKIKPNGFYGFRSRETLENKELWYSVNKKYGISMIISGVVFFIFSFIFGTWKESDCAFYNNLMLFILAVTIPVIISLLKIKRGV